MTERNMRKQVIFTGGYRGVWKDCCYETYREIGKRFAETRCGQDFGGN